MWHIIVVGELLPIERFAGAGRSSHKNLDWLETALLTEFVLDNLDVDSKATFAMPVEVNRISSIIF